MQMDPDVISRSIFNRIIQNQDYSALPHIPKPDRKGRCLQRVMGSEQRGNAGGDGCMDG